MIQNDAFFFFFLVFFVKMWRSRWRPHENSFTSLSVRNNTNRPLELRNFFMKRDLFYTPTNYMWSIDYKSTVTKKMAVRIFEFILFREFVVYLSPPSITKFILGDQKCWDTWNLFANNYFQVKRTENPIDFHKDDTRRHLSQPKI